MVKSKAFCALALLVVAVVCASCGEEESAETDSGSQVEPSADLGPPPEPDPTEDPADVEADKKETGDASAQATPSTDATDADADVADADAADATDADADVADADAGNDVDGAAEPSDTTVVSITPPDPWKLVTCDASFHCVVDSELTPAIVLQLKAATDGADKKIVLTLHGTISWYGLVLLGPLKERIEGLRLIDLPGLYNLVGLEALDGLKLLQLKNLPDVTDLGPIGGLLELTRLHIEGIGCADLKPIANLSKITDLNLSVVHRVCRIDLSHLEALVNVERMKLYTPNVTNLESLQNAQALKELSIWGYVKNNDPLASLDGLQSLTLHALPLKDLRPLARIKSLTTLNILASRVWDYSPLAKARKLRYLHVSEGKTLILEQVRMLRQLRGLTIHRAKPKDWAVLKEMPWLAELDLSYTDFSDVSMLSAFPRLRAFSCAGCRLKHAKGFAELRRLQEINIAGAGGISGLRLFYQMEALSRVTVAKRQFTRAAIRALIRKRPDVQISYGPKRYAPLEPF